MHLDRATDNPHQEKPLYQIDPRDRMDFLCYVPATAEDMKQTLEAAGDTIGGKPTASSAENGKKYHEHLVKWLLEVLSQLTVTSHQ